MIKRWIAGALFLLFVQANNGTADLLILVANVGQSKVAPGGMQPGGGPGPGMPGPGLPGPGPGMPGPGMPGPGFPGPGMPGPGGEFGGQELLEEVVSNVISVVVDFESGQPLNKTTLMQYNYGVRVLFAKTRWGVGPFLSKEKMVENGDIHVIAEVPITVDSKNIGRLTPSAGKLYNEFATEFSQDKDQNLEKAFALAERALAYGMIDKYVEVMSKYVEHETHKTHPSIVAFTKVHAALKDRTLKAPTGPVVTKLRESNRYKVETGPYHQMFHNLAPADFLEAKSRMDRLKTAYETIFYWYALKGIELPMPEEKLLTILTSSHEDYKHLNQLLGKGPSVADSFHARRENLSVFGFRRTDRAYDALEKYASSTYFADGSMSRSDLAKVRVGVLPKSYPEQQAMSITVMLKAMEAQGEIASTSHQTGRQLLFATGLVPQNVHIPEWVQFGFSSFFETPLDSAIGSAGFPSSLHLPAFRELQKAPPAKDKIKGGVERIESTLTTDTVKAVVTDSFFRQAALIAESKDRYPYQVKARATAWALMYYLLRNEREGLQRYFKELGRLPRDMEIDEEQLWICFAKGFDAFDARTGTVNANKLNQLARNWNRDMGYVKLDSKEMLDQVAAIRKHVEKIAKGEVQPMNPGGQPGGPGGPAGPGGGRP